MYVRPKKRLGQHFLTDMSVAQRIAAALCVSYCNKTLEIGPGTGVLTQFLLAREDIELCAVEVDSESVEYLKVEFPQLNLIEADFLEMNFEGEFFERFNVVGNFPYNISSQIFFRILEKILLRFQSNNSLSLQQFPSCILLHFLLKSRVL